MSRGSVATATLCALVLLASGVAGGVLVTESPVSSALETPEAKGVVDVVTRDFSDRRELKFEVLVSQERAVTSTASGLITSTTCSAGAKIRSGDSIMMIDDAPVLALATTIPLWRDLALGSRGRDVAALNAELTRLGLTPDPGEQFGRATRAAVVELKTRAGALRPKGDLPTSATMWLPKRSMKIGSCAIARGDRFGGGKVAATGGAVVGLKVRHTPDGVVAGDRLVDLGGSTIKVTDGKITDQKAISAFLASPEYVAWKMSEAGEDPALPWFLANPREIAVVPPGALGRIEAGKACLGTPTGAVAVDVLGSSMGQSFVATADGAVPRQVLARATPELECS